MCMSMPPSAGGSLPAMDPYGKVVSAMMRLATLVLVDHPREVIEAALAQVVRNGRGGLQVNGPVRASAPAHERLDRLRE